MELDLNSITPTDFKNFFFRDFSYLQLYISGKIYNKGNLVFIDEPEGFFTCLNDGVTSFPTDESDWVKKDDLQIKNFILDEDIEKSFCEAQQNFNKGLFTYIEDQLSLGDLTESGTNLNGLLYFDGVNANLGNSKLKTIDVDNNIDSIFLVSEGFLRVTLNNVNFDILDINFTNEPSPFTEFSIARVLQKRLKLIQVTPIRTSEENKSFLVFSKKKLQEVHLAYLYLTAHYLVLDIDTAFQGVNGKGSSIAISRSVGNVSESYSVPKIYADNPYIEYFYKTPYGQKYISLAINKTIGNINVVEGGTTP